MECVLLSLTPIFFKVTPLMFIHSGCTYTSITYCSLFDNVVNITVGYLFLHVRRQHIRTCMFVRSDKYNRTLYTLSFLKLFYRDVRNLESKRTGYASH